MAIMALNLSIFAANTHVLGAYIERTNPTVEQYGYGWGLWGCFMFFVIFELSIYCCHRFLLHGCLYKYHKMHHARTCDGISGMDLFYMHPVDLVMQFLATSDLAYIGSGCDFVTFKFTTLLTMWMYVMAHSRIINVAMDEWDHLEHHRDGSYYHGTGVFADLLFDKKYREKNRYRRHLVELRPGLDRHADLVLLGSLLRRLRGPLQLPASHHGTHHLQGLGSLRLKWHA